MAQKTTSLVPYNPTSVPDRLTPLWVADKTKVTSSGNNPVSVLVATTGTVTTSDSLVFTFSTLGIGTSAGPYTYTCTAAESATAIIAGAATLLNTHTGTGGTLAGWTIVADGNYLNFTSPDSPTAATPDTVTINPTASTHVLIDGFNASLGPITVGSSDAAPAALRLNRVQSASFSNNTGVIEVSEMGTQYRVGGVDELGECTFKMDMEAVGITNAAAICGVSVGTGSGDVTTVGLTQFQSALVDIFRFVADKQNNVYGTLYIQDGVIDEYSVDVRSNGTITESVSGKGPNATYFAGFIIPKTYVVQAGDISSGTCSINLSNNILGADELPVKLPTVSGTQPPSYWEQNGAVWFLKIEQVPSANLANNPVRYYEAGHVSGITATYNNSTTTLTFPANAITAGDLIRLVMLSYNTDSFPTSIPATSPDTADRAAVHARLIPVTINAVQTTRIQSASIRFSLRRDHVNGVGENTIIYGIPMIPDVSINMDVKESDPAFLSLLATGNDYISGTSGSGTIANDFVDLSYPTRWELDPANAMPFTVTVKDPFTSNTLLTYSTPQFVVKGIDFTSSNKADNTIRLTGMYIIGQLTLIFTHPK